MAFSSPCTSVNYWPLDGGVAKVKIVVENEGYLPTNITQRAL